ncbi:CDP-glycerol glycerophosphotransferase family protein [Paeniglutamicibacter antarcticus]|uniref:CDP-glycerol glycerophosphotransferase family protein n=1 Tax=Paeniglutamicibacter antarcticus TaxID=494023 RepID=A0ABP9TJQ7_9MICC
MIGQRQSIGSPVLAIFYGGPAGDLYQLKQWLPVFEQFQDELPTVLLVKNSVAALQLAKNSALPIQMAGNADSIEPLAYEWGLSAIFYVNNNLANFSVLRLADVRHIHLSHGESEKSSMVSNQLKAYDYCFVAGRASAERITSSLSLFDDSHLKQVGRPQLDQLAAATPISSSTDRATVLYAPTWEGDRPAMAYSSVASAGEKWISELLEDPTLRIIYRPHPKTGTRNSSAKQADIRIRSLIANATKGAPGAGHIVDTNSDCYPAMVSADVAVFDVSAMAMDYSTLKRPFFVTVPAALAGDLRDSPLWDAAEPLSTSAGSGLGEVINRALVKEMPSGSEMFVLHHFGADVPGTRVQSFQKAIQSVI